MSHRVTDDQAARAFALARAAELIADGSTEIGKRARRELPEETGLSPENVDLALLFSLEHEASRATILQLGARLPSSERSHVLLSANVFVAAYRAILIGILQGQTCQVRASRRAQTMARLLAEGSNGAFELVQELQVEPGDHVWAYAHDSTLDELRKSLPQGARLHAHGSGMAAAVLFEPLIEAPEEELDQLACDLTTDIILFDQRGCLSPRILLLQGSEDFARDFQGRLQRALEDAETQVPRGSLSPEEAAAEKRYVMTFEYVGGLLHAGQGSVTFDPEPERLIVPPIGRHLHITRTAAPLDRLKELGPALTAVAHHGQPHLPGLLLEAIGERRMVPFGQLQRPPLDGPVDLRSGIRPEIIGET